MTDELNNLFIPKEAEPAQNRLDDHRTSTRIEKRISQEGTLAVIDDIAGVLEIDIDYATPSIIRDRAIFVKNYKAFEEATIKDKTRAKEVLEAARKPVVSGYADYNFELSRGFVPVELEKAAEIKDIRQRYRPLDNAIPSGLIGDEKKIVNDLRDVRSQWEEMLLFLMPAAWTGSGKVYVRSYLQAYGRLQQLIRVLFASALKDKEPVKSAIRDQFTTLAELRTKIELIAEQEA